MAGGLLTSLASHSRKHAHMSRAWSEASVFSESVTGANIAVQVGRFVVVLLLCEINNRSADGAGVAGIARRLAFKLNDSRLAEPVCVCAWVCGCDMRARTHAHMGARCLWLNKCEKIQSFGKGEGGCSVYGEGMALV